MSLMFTDLDYSDVATAHEGLGTETNIHDLKVKLLLHSACETKDGKCEGCNFSCKVGMLDEEDAFAAEILAIENLLDSKG